MATSTSSHQKRGYHTTTCAENDKNRRQHNNVDDLLKLVEAPTAWDVAEAKQNYQGGKYKGKPKKDRLLDSAPLPEHDRGKQRSVSQAKHSARIHEHLCTLFSQHRVNLRGFDPSDVDILQVLLSPDGKNATIWWDVSAYDMSEKEMERLQVALNRVSYKLRTTIATARRMRVAPHFEWRCDRERVQEQANLDELFAQAKEDMSKIPTDVIEQWELEETSRVEEEKNKKKEKWKRKMAKKDKLVEF